MRRLGRREAVAAGEALLARVGRADRRSADRPQLPGVQQQRVAAVLGHPRHRRTQAFLARVL